MKQINRIHFQIIDSTNNWAKQHAHEFDREAFTLITAETQSAGRGRFNRKWISPAGQNIYATFVFFFKTLSRDLLNLPQVLSISTAKVLEKLHFKPQIKWPNDLLLSKKKVAGILCETTAIENYYCVILGIGLNINMHSEDLIAIDIPATSLFREDGKIRDIEEMTLILQQEFFQDLETFLIKGFTFFLPLYRQYLVHKLDKTLNFHDNQKIVYGKFKGIQPDGSLSLELTTGLIQNFYAGEIL